MNRRLPTLLVLLALSLPFAACDDGGSSGVDLTKPVTFDVDAAPETNLSAYNLFAWDPATGFQWNDRVVPYEMNSPLFTDYALKARAVYLPPGATAAYHPNDVLDFPVGTVIVKNFYFPADFRAPNDNLRLVETRLLVHRTDGWTGYPYIWNQAQTEAVYSPGGAGMEISFVDAGGVTKTANYLVPQRNQCQSCHSHVDPASAIPPMTPIGPKARHLNRDFDYGGTVGSVNTLQHLASLGMLTGLPSLDQVPRAYDFRPIEANGVSAVPPAELDKAARDYLDINCAHCHNPNGTQGITSQLFLNHDNTDMFRLGVCKRPGSAGAGTGGFTFDIVPGSPDTSILYYRVHTEEVGAMMPLIGRSLEHQRGAELLHAWIAAMPAQTCTGQ
ncbi:MAG: SO2930 family diheme c-type cytochrome [Polyangiales bacterium]